MLSKNWSFYRKSQISLKAWEPDMNVEELDFKSVHVWIQLPKLNWRFWSRKAMSKLVSFVGFPISMDKLTTKRARLSYARILVEVNIKAPLPEFIPITSPEGEIFKQLVVYEHLLAKCDTCGFTRHNADQCRKKVTATTPVQSVAEGVI